ncbi:hypothetical protein L6164_003704 [Bauhinia variegata]|uniref:Uncharacterized protein n=1 Tax=Bauhinia variegata TaxID=167791 RepID=A0ACB9Q277_BAUVA|nr:hypothetical protein L6164_003704 [Bauhinia variegata]
MEIAIAVASKLLECSVVPLVRMRYLIYYRSFSKELKNELEELKLLVESVQHRVEAAKRNGEEIAAVIVKWLGEVDEIVEEAKLVLQYVSQLRTGCSPNLTLRYRLGRKSMYMTSAIIDLRIQCQYFGEVSHRATISYRGGSRATDFNSRVSTLESIMESLKDPNLNMIGVYGLGGVGKTTLVMQVANKAKENNLFDLVVWVTVSNTPVLERIQGQIADCLGLEFDFDENTVAGRAARLRDRLMKEKYVLIILDDIWEELALDEVGIPVPEQKTIKILMTSRSQQVLRDKMNTQKDFLLTILPEKEAWDLFKKEAGIEPTDSPELLSIATKVAAECNGLPVAIMALASSLKSKGKRVEEWKKALESLSAPTDKTGMRDDIIEGLEKDAESIFYLCGLIMRENDFAKLDLFRYSVGLGLFEDFDKLKDVRDRLDTCISRLEDLNLLMKGSSGEFSKMQNTIREKAMLLASKHRHYFKRRLQEGEQWPNGDKLKNCTTILLSDHDINEHPEGLDCQNISFFQLLKTESSSNLPHNFFKGVRHFKVALTDKFFSNNKMLGLKVLDLTAVEFISGRLPSSINHLEKLTTLCLDYCVLEDIAGIGKLKVLKILSLSNSSIRELPHQLGQLTQLQFLDLSYCFQLEMIPSNVFSKLEKLEELYMLGSFDDWDVKKQQQSTASIFELTNLPRLTTLEVIIPYDKMLPGPEDTNRLFGSLRRSKLLMGRHLEFHQFFEHETSAALKLWLSSAVTENMKSLLACVDHLGIGNSEGANNIVPQLNKAGFPKLKYLVVGHNEIQCLADHPSGSSSDIDLFPNLDLLVLRSVRNLEKLCSGPLMKQSFSRLKFITVTNCNKLNTLFSFSLVRGLPHLLKIDLECCDGMKGIVSDDGDAAAGTLQFLELRNLYLKNLPALVGFRCKEITRNNDLDAPGSLFCDMVNIRIYITVLDYYHVLFPL